MEALRGALPSRRGLSEHLRRLEHLGTAGALFAESSTFCRYGISRHCIDIRRRRHAALAGRKTDRVQLSQVGLQRGVGIESRRLSGETADELQRWGSGRKPFLEARR